MAVSEYEPVSLDSQEKDTAEDNTDSAGSFADVSSEHVDSAERMPALEELEDKPTGAVEPILSEEEIAAFKPPEESIPVPVFPEGDLVNKIITDEDLRALWVRTVTARENVLQLINKQVVANNLFNLIEQTREKLLQGKEQYEQADNLISQVEFHIQNVLRIRHDSRRVAPFLFAYELVMMGLFAAGMAFIIQPVLGISTIIGTVNVNQFISSLLWGSLGGVVGALYALWRHVASKQDFDARYSMWYLTNPILGLALGAFIFLAFQAGFFSLTAGTANEEPIRSAYVIYLFAWIVGFKQNVVYEIVRRILDVFAIKKEEETTLEMTGTGTSS